MKSFALTLMLSLAMLSAAAQNITPSNQKYAFTEASDLTVIGKLFDIVYNVVGFLQTEIRFYLT